MTSVSYFNGISPLHPRYPTPASFVLWTQQTSSTPQTPPPTPPHHYHCHQQPLPCPIVRCAGCRQPISSQSGRLCLNDGRSWHADNSGCLACCECGERLGGGVDNTHCYARPDGRIFCPRDYFGYVLMAITDVEDRNWFLVYFARTNCDWLHFLMMFEFLDCHIFYRTILTRIWMCPLQ